MRSELKTLVLVTIVAAVSVRSDNISAKKKAECLMWSKLENKTLPLQNQGHAKCSTNDECTGFSCNGIYQGKEIRFGMRIIPCETPPGVEIFGYAPQYNAKNFSHVFYHKAEYEVPGAILNISMLPPDGVIPDDKHTKISGRLEVHLKMNHDNNTITIGLKAKACINSTCIFSRPVFNNTEIPVPDCPNAIPKVKEEPKVFSPCQMVDIASCGKNQICQQLEAGSDLGSCECLPGFSLQDDMTCLSVVEEEAVKRAEATAKEVNRPKKSIPKKLLPFVDQEQPVSVPHEMKDSNNGAIAAVIISLLAILAVIGGAIAVVTKTSMGTRLRARLTSTPYGDIVINDRGQMMGSTTTLESESTSNRNAFA